MRTAIYVYSATANFTIDQGVAVHPNAGSVVSQSGSQFTLAKGIYKTASAGLESTSTSDYDIVAVIGDKDPWPDPPPRFWKAFPNITSQQLSDFLPSSLGAQSAASDATVECEDADWPEIRDALAKAGFSSTRASRRRAA
jgi:hypothetical protein